MKEQKWKYREKWAFMQGEPYLADQRDASFFT
jgi:hypothetical protein